LVYRVGDRGEREEKRKRFSIKTCE
jgi:hypothetical protein